MNEIWEDVVGYEGYYQASNTGKIRSVDRTISRINVWGFISDFKHKGKELAGTRGSNGYKMVVLSKNKCKICRMWHRVIAETFIAGYSDVLEVDHKDRDLENNNSDNLRIVTRTQNGMNRAVQKNNKTGFKGVHYSKETGKYCAMIRIDGKTKNLGYYVNIEDAVSVYDKKAYKIYGEYAYLNRSI